MKKHLNNKGYMLVEIILASVIAMGVAYFITELTIKLKNKNDDLLVKTLVYTDQAIMYNTIMKDLYYTSDVINCNYIDSKMNISGQTFTYDGFTNVLTEYASLGDYTCTNIGVNQISLVIPVSVLQLPDEKFDVIINYG